MKFKQLLFLFDFFSFLENKYKCAGVIINSLWILTSLHCIPEDPSLTFTELDKQKNSTKENIFISLGVTKVNMRGKLIRQKRAL